MPLPTITRNYSEFLTRIAGLIGTTVSAFTADELTFLNAYFNNNMKTAWQFLAWVDVCPYGEARFIGNSLFYPHDQTQTTYWTATNVTASANGVANPIDNRVTTGKILETSATGNHSVAQSFTVTPGATYTQSVYARPIGGRYLYVATSDGVSSYTSFFNLQAGTLGTASANIGSGACSITQLANGFYLCSISFTASTSATSGTSTFQASSDGSTLSYAGDATKGLYLWGALTQQTSLCNSSASLLPDAQLGESIIDTFYQAWQTNPLNAQWPVSLGIQTTPLGSQIIGSSTWNYSTLNGQSGFTAPFANPIYIYYRTPPFIYAGSAYSAASTYAIGDIIQFTNSASVINYYTCLIATAAGQSPTTAAASWSINYIPDVFFPYCVYKSYADWLRADGQFDKAELQDDKAEEILNAEIDNQEREMGVLPQFKVSTHVTSR